MRALISTRTLSAVALGAGCDFLISLDAYPYSERYHHTFPVVAGIGIFWLGLLLPFLYALGFGLRRRQPHIAAIPLAILSGITVTHTIVLARDVITDPTTHNLLPFEYLYIWIVIGVPAFAGSLLAWAICRLRKRT